MISLLTLNSSISFFEAGDLLLDRDWDVTVTYLHRGVLAPWSTSPYLDWIWCPLFLCYDPWRRSLGQFWAPFRPCYKIRLIRGLGWTNFADWGRNSGICLPPYASICQFHCSSLPGHDCSLLHDQLLLKTITTKLILNSRHLNISAKLNEFSYLLGRGRR